MTNPSSTDGFDEFRSDEKTGYSPNNWYTRSTNSKGFDKSLKVVAVPPELMGAIEALVQNPRTPLRTRADAFRDALVHWVNLRTHQLQDPDFNSAATIFTRQVEAERLREIGAGMRDVIKTREDHFTEEHDPVMIKRIVEEAKKDLLTMTSDYYREQMQRLIDRYDR